MKQTIRNLHTLAQLFYARQAEFVEAHPGDEEILFKRLYGSTAPRYVEILGILTQFDPKYGEEDLGFLLKSFAESLNSIGEASLEVQTAFYYSAFDQFLKDFHNVLRTGLVAWKRETPNAEVVSMLIRKEPVLEFA
jgi:hypothetical protein